ncbi:hypothetical protein V474_04735 [Novosphingobium barchaimii LL02]|uniref:Uncharacterized protein n=1 Tax=Novosphingobium barchaimii LL02 TaxID=1114963 RepID=A0A0J7XIV3_9SPHN|nr:hypothetical protein V474_04735 [Novosphingobium barchaimii LL02]
MRSWILGVTAGVALGFLTFHTLAAAVTLAGICGFVSHAVSTESAARRKRRANDGSSPSDNGGEVSYENDNHDWSSDSFSFDGGGDGGGGDGGGGGD